MRIAIIGQKGIPAKSGGVEKHVEDLAVHLVALGHEVLVYARPNYTDKKLKEYKGVKIISLPSISTKNLDAITHTFRACLDVAKREVDVIHFHSIGPSSLIWLVKLLKPKTPVIATVHCPDYRHQKWGIFAKAYLKFGELVACTLADKTIAVSKILRDYAVKNYNSKAEYIPNGVSIVNKKIGENTLKYFNLKKDGYILAVSRLVKHKGLQYLIEAFKNIKTDKKLVIVGASAHTDKFVRELKDLARGDKRIIFTGERTGAILDELFANCYLFVQPSESEGLSIALLEAMAHGKTALVSDIAENKEAIGYAGFTFKDKNAADLLGKLNCLLRNSEIVKETGERALSRVNKEYNWNEIVDKVINVYSEVVLQKKRASSKLAKLNFAGRFLNLFF
jgi:glycosyltransferase involved in cell wall biosynthesis